MSYINIQQNLPAAPNPKKFLKNYTFETYRTTLFYLPFSSPKIQLHLALESALSSHSKCWEISLFTENSKFTKETLNHSMLTSQGSTKSCLVAENF